MSRNIDESARARHQRRDYLVEGSWEEGGWWSSSIFLVHKIADDLSVEETREVLVDVTEILGPDLYFIIERKARDSLEAKKDAEEREAQEGGAE